MSDIYGPSRTFTIINNFGFTGPKPQLSSNEALVHLIKVYTGAAIFAMGTVFKNSGVVFGPIVISVIVFIILHCQHLLIEASVKVAKNEHLLIQPNFAETVQYTFEDSDSHFLRQRSKFFGILVNIFIVVTEYGCCICHYIFLGVHFCQLAHTVGVEANYRLMLFIILLPMCLTMFLNNLKHILPSSFIGTTLMILGVLTVIYYSCDDLKPIYETEFTVYDGNFQVFFGIVIFAFDAITFVLPIRMEMKNPEFCTKPFGLLNVSMVIALALNLFVGLFSYWRYGNDVKSSVFLNLPEEYGVSQVVMALILFAIFFTFALHLYVIFEVTYPLIHQKFGPFKHPHYVMCACRLVPVIVTYLMANISKDIITLMAVIGNISGVILAMITPCILELVSSYVELTMVTVCKNLIIISFAICGSMVGTTLSLRQIIRRYANINSTDYYNNTI